MYILFNTNDQGSELIGFAYYHISDKSSINYGI